MEEEKAIRSLEIALGNVGQASQLGAAEDGIKRLSKMAAVADDDLRPAMQTLVTATGDVAKSQALLQTALDASAATGKDLQTVTLAIAKASNGQIGALTRLGIPLDANIVKTKNFGAAIDVMNAKFGGQAAAAADTYAGQMKSVTIAVDEAKETIGFALLDAVSNATDAFGGSGGMVSAIEGAAEKTADLVAGIGLATTALADLIAAADDVRLGTDETSVSVLDLGKSILTSLPVIGAQAKAFEYLTESGAEYRVEQDRITASLKGSESLYAGYIASLDGAAVSTRGAALDADALAEAQKDIKDSFLEVTAALSQQASMDSWRKALLGIKDALDKTSTSLDATSLAGLNNRDAVRTMFSDSQKAAEDWGIKYNKTQDEVEAKTASMYAKNRAALIAAGLKAGDVDRFLGGLGLWDARIKALASGLTMGQAAAGMRYAGMAMGKDLSQGVADGITAASPAVNAASARLIKQAEAYARAAAESHSPSQLFYRIGEDLGEGLTLGLEVVWPRLAADINKGMDGLTVTIRGKSTEVAGALLEGFNSRAEGFKAVLDTQVGIIQSAQQALDSYAASITSTVMGNVDFSTTNADGTAMSPEQIVNSIFGSIENQNAAVASIATNIGASLPVELLNKILAMPSTTAVALADYLGAHPEMLTKLGTNYQALATATNTTLGVPMAAAWATVGGESATAMIASAKTTIADGAEAFKKWVKNHLGTTVTVKVNYDTSGAPVGARALGGPVGAGMPYIVGEKGPELFVPGTSGAIVPNDLLHASSGGGSTTAGNTYAITVQAGVGDPRAIGQTIVEMVKRYENANGAVWAAA